MGLQPSFLVCIRRGLQPAVEPIDASGFSARGVDATRRATSTARSWRDYTSGGKDEPTRDCGHGVCFPKSKYVSVSSRCRSAAGAADRHQGAADSRRRYRQPPATGYQHHMHCLYPLNGHGPGRGVFSMVQTSIGLSDSDMIFKKWQHLKKTGTANEE